VIQTDATVSDHSGMVSIQVALNGATFAEGGAVRMVRRSDMNWRGRHDSARSCARTGGRTLTPPRGTSRQPATGTGRVGTRSVALIEMLDGSG
jgi:hypothetical protein